MSRKPRRLARSALPMLVAALALAGCATNDRDDLASYVDQLHSDAAEGVLLSQQAAQGKVPVSFTWIHSAELEHHVDEMLDHFTRAMPDRGLLGSVEQATKIADQMSSEFGELHFRANTPAVAAQVKQGLNSQVSAAESLYKRLQ